MRKPNNICCCEKPAVTFVQAVDICRVHLASFNGRQRGASRLYNKKDELKNNTYLKRKKETKDIERKST